MARRLTIASVLLAALMPALAWGARRPVVTATCLQEDGRKTCVVRATGEQAARYLDREMEHLCPLGKELLAWGTDKDSHWAAIRCESRVK
jgi:hypothetical protein